VLVPPGGFGFGNGETGIRQADMIGTDDPGDDAAKLKAAFGAETGKPVPVLRVTVDTQRDPTDVIFQIVELTGELPRLFGGTIKETDTDSFQIPGSWGVAIQHAPNAAVTGEEWWLAATKYAKAGGSKIAPERETALKKAFDEALARRDAALSFVKGFAWKGQTKKINEADFTKNFVSGAGGQYLLLVKDGEQNWKKVNIP
jgi:hypothetical protein